MLGTVPPRSRCLIMVGDDDGDDEGQEETVLCGQKTSPSWLTPLRMVPGIY